MIKINKGKGVKNLKKNLIGLALAVICMLGTTPAFAYVNGWTLDLSSYGLGTYSNVDRLVASGFASINQDFGADHQLSNGDLFTETSVIQSMNYWTEPGFPPSGEYEALNLGNYKLYAYGTNLSGSVYNVSGSSFDYAFDSGSILKLYLDTDLDPTNGFTGDSATFSVVNPSGGQGSIYLGGLGPNGTSDLTMLLTSSQAGLLTWYGLS